MSDPTSQPGTPPITKPSPVAPEPPHRSHAGLIWLAVAVVVLSFVAAFLGSWLARSMDTAEPAPTPTPAPTQTLNVEDYEAALEEILPAGSAVRAGSGVPEAGKGSDGDVYIDVTTSDVYVFEDGNWTFAGNIRKSAAENLTGATGAAGATGETGATGAAGEPGESGTQVTLGVGEPADAECDGDDIYIDTEAPMFYQCSDGAWQSFGPPTTDEAPQE
ncbi:MAG: hypothetical protein WBX17_05045 [Microbacterium sp.]